MVSVSNVPDFVGMPLGWQGSLRLVYARPQLSTQIIHQQTQAPLKLQRSFYPEGSEVCHSVILHTAGGVVGGDRLTLNLELQPQAQALVTTAAASKIYRSNGQTAHQTVHIKVSEGACIEWLPQETIVFDQALYQQDLRVELAANATWLGWEMTRLGRSARGERFLAGLWRSRTEIWREGRLLWIDPQYLQGGSRMLTSPHGLDGQPVVGSLAFVGVPIAQEILDQIRQLWTESELAGEVGVTRLQEGLLCRYRGSSTTEARQCLMAVWQVLRPLYLGRSLCVPRVWQR